MPDICDGFAAVGEQKRIVYTAIPQAGRRFEI
jgi:hypothetical protein